MGGVFGGMLVRGGHAVTLVDVWREAIDTINTRGLRIDDKSGASTIVRAHATNRAADAGSVDLVLVFTKCYHTEAAVTAAKDIVGPRTSVLSLQNGWGNAGRIAGLVGPEKVLLGVTYHSATLAGPGHVQHMAKGVTHVGALSEGADARLAEIATAFNAAGIETQVAPTIREQIWSKLALNVVSLPTAALLRCFAGDLAVRAGTVELMQQLLHEVVTVAHRMGIRLDYQERWQAILGVLEKAKTAKPSMLQDVEKKRPTEIDVINGAIVAEGKRLGVATPYNHTLVTLIQALEDGFSPPGSA